MTSAPPQPPAPPARRTYSYLGPAGTFTEAALAQVPEARGGVWKSVRNVAEALEDVVEGRSDAAMIAIENSVDGGVSTAQDALATMPGVRIVGEYLVPVRFVLVGRPGATLDDVSLVAAHPVAYAQCLRWLGRALPAHAHLPAASNVASALELLDGTSGADAAISPPGILEHHDLELLAEDIGDNPNAVTRFVLVARTIAPQPPTGADKTSLIVELPDDHPGALLEMLEQFATRGINLSLLASRPIGDALGRYRFVIDADGHIQDERMADALLGLRRFSPRVIFLGSYPRADRAVVRYPERYSDDIFVEARDWLRGLITGEPGVR
ncbi:prephenate dehydratase [Microbacterium aurantiacum]|uniref:Prephenate dehydratase n=2 Tax=Microbacterium aurantiacum TaxID=162393 RepID=A0ABT8FVX5_9MICO|nr:MULTISPECIES: prephenate dehydratase [Microbacterium]ODT12009.1 MAG: prephenate dehydratase [Microbacterium sp. SCN 70-18]ANG84262.1 prephenate dehydratase [Microbacterium chocolatum]KOS11797.1 prephenate dehydratase [Microbacterium chocolatum]MBN9201274.1 prephenate dehydratase [Microbacterium chocolatum]MDN4465467.1 prephenate dehydratase [Microbacterium aurantiacum]